MSSIPKRVRLQVYEKYDHHCAYCGKVLEYKHMQVDHIRAKVIGGDDNLDNLNPSCRRCNHYKRCRGINSFRDLLVRLHLKLEDNYLHKVAIDYGVVSIKPFDGVFYFEKYNKLCEADGAK